MTGKSFKILFVVMTFLVGIIIGALSGIVYMQNLSWDDTPVFLESKTGEIFNDVQKIEVQGDGKKEIDADIFRMNIVFPDVQKMLAMQSITTAPQLIDQITKDFTERKIDLEKVHLNPLTVEQPEMISVQVTVADRELLEQVLEYFMVLGVTQIRQIDLDSVHLEEGKQESAIAAMQDAREKANFIAGTEGKKVKGVFSIEYNPTTQIKVTKPTLSLVKLDPKLVESLLGEKITIESNIKVNYKF